MQEAPKTGLRFNAGKLKWHLMHYGAMSPMIKGLMYGAHKYTTFEDSNGRRFTGAEIPISDAHKYKIIYSGADNWKKGLVLKEVLDCAQRHLAAIMDGELIDRESGVPHIGLLMCNVKFFSFFTETEEGKKIIEEMHDPTGPLIDG